MKLFACMCNQAQRLAEALAPVRAALIAPPPVNRWGLGYIQGGDVLLVRTPKTSEVAIDLAAPLAEIATDCAIAQAIVDPQARFPGTDNTPPFRFRRWLFAQTGAFALADLGDAGPRLLAQVPEYLRRNMKGRTPAELAFHLFLARLQEDAHLDDPNLPVAVTRRALAATLATFRDELARDGSSVVPGNVALTNGRSMVVARASDEPLRVRRLFVTGDRGERDDFRGVIVISGGDGDPRDGFEDVPVGHGVLVPRDLSVALADLST